MVSVDIKPHVSKVILMQSFRKVLCEVFARFQPHTETGPTAHRPNTDHYTDSHFSCESKSKHIFIFQNAALQLLAGTHPRTPSTQNETIVFIFFFPFFQYNSDISLKSNKQSKQNKQVN